MAADWRELFEERVEAASTYEHTACGEGTSVSRDITDRAILDPWAYSLDGTYCAGCADFVPTKECIQEDGRTVYEAMVENRRSAPLSFKVVRFVVLPLLFALVGAAVGFALTNYAAIAVAGFLIGLLVSYLLVCRFVMPMFRRAGMFWEIE